MQPVCKGENLTTEQTDIVSNCANIKISCFLLLIIKFQAEETSFATSYFKDADNI